MTNVTTRYRQDKKIWEARLTIGGKRKSFYGSTSESASAKAHDYLGQLKSLPPKVSGSTLGGFIAREVAPLYASKAPATR